MCAFLPPRPGVDYHKERTAKPKPPAVIAALKKFTRWLNSLKSVDEAAQNQAVNTVVGCFHVLEASPTMDLRAWMGRQPRRKKLKAPAKAMKFKTARHAIGELIWLTIAELEASKAFLTDVEVGPLPMPKPRPSTLKQREALRHGRSKLVQTRADRRAEIDRRHEAEKQLDQ